jgi:hypothetical protein
LNSLEQRRADAVAKAVLLSATAGELLDVAAELRSKATELRIAASEVRLRPCGIDASDSERSHYMAWFTVRGFVDGRLTSAHWWPGRLDCDQDVLQRMQVVVGMGECFIPPWEPGASIRASLDGPPVAVLLTLMRAFSSVTSVDLCRGTLRGDLEDEHAE